MSLRWSSSERQRAYRDPARRRPTSEGLDTPRSILATGSTNECRLVVGRVASASERIETPPDDDRPTEGLDTPDARSSRRATRPASAGLVVGRVASASERIETPLDDDRPTEGLDHRRSSSRGRAPACRRSSSERQRAYRDPADDDRPTEGLDTTLVPRDERSAFSFGRVASASERIETRPTTTDLPRVSIRPTLVPRDGLLDQRVLGLRRWSSSERQRAYRDPARRRPTYRGSRYARRSFLATGYSTSERRLLVGRVASASERIETPHDDDRPTEGLDTPDARSSRRATRPASRLLVGRVASASERIETPPDDDRPTEGLDTRPARGQRGGRRPGGLRWRPAPAGA